MKRISLKKLFFALLLLFSICIFSSCTNNKDDNDDAKVVTSIKVVDSSIAEAQALEIFDYQAIKLHVTYDDGTEEDLALSADMLGEDMIKKFSVKGTQKITVKYGGLQTTFEIKVAMATVKKIGVNEESLANALKETYFDFSKVLIDLYYSSGEVKTTALKGNMFNLTDLAKLYTAGSHEATITYNSLTTTIKVDNEKDLYISVSDLANVSEGSYVAIKAYATTYGSNNIYLSDATGGTYVKTNYNVTNKAKLANELDNNYEIIVVGKKASENGISILEDSYSLCKTGNIKLDEASDVTTYDDLNTKLFSFVNVDGATLCVTPGVMSTKKDVTLEIKFDDTSMLLVVPADTDDTYSEKLFTVIDDMCCGSKLILNNVLIGKYNSETAILINESSDISFEAGTHTYQKEEEGTKNVAFDTFLTETFIEMLGTSPFNINYQIYDVAAFDLKFATDLSHAIVEATTIEDMSPEAELEVYEEYKELKKDLTAFDYNTLSTSQKLSYDVLLDYINSQLRFFDINEDGENVLFYYGTQLGSYLGYQAQLPSLLADYRFDDKKDIEDYLEYLKTCQDDFEALYSFEKAKVTNKKGNQLCDYVIDLVIEQCDNFIETDEVNYLITVFNDRIGDYDFLTSKEVEDYKKKNADYVNNYFIPAYSWLKASLLELKEINDDKTAGALCNTEYGKEYYEVLFQSECGTDMTIEELIVYIDEKLEEVEKAQNILTEYSGNMMVDSGVIKYIQGTKNVDYYASLYAIIPYYQTQCLSDFPSLTSTYAVGENITIKEIPAALQENSSPAYYLVSPFDADTDELFYINPLQFGDVDTYMFQTVAHEAWPGHLYQNVYYKSTDHDYIRNVLSYSGYSEGWAKYVENYVVKYALPDNYSAQMLALLDSAASLSSCKMDIGINYLGWDIDDVIEAYGITREDVEKGRYVWSSGEKIKMEDFEEIYYFYVEVPTNYLMYYFSACQLIDIRAEFKEAMGVNYSDLLFHTIFLETGDCSYTVLRKVYQDYASKWGANVK